MRFQIIYAVFAATAMAVPHGGAQKETDQLATSSISMSMPMKRATAATTSVSTSMPVKRATPAASSMSTSMPMKRTTPTSHTAPSASASLKVEKRMKAERFMMPF